jgi:hypothetical protein
MAENTVGRRARPQFSDEFKEGAGRIVLNEAGRSMRSPVG